MKIRPVLLLTGLVLLSAAAVPFLTRGAQASQAGSVPAADAAQPAYRLELLDLGFAAASALPLSPHVKNRSRAQEGIVEACFELDLPERGLRYAGSIANWRRGVGYADYALHLARTGATEEAQDWIERAAEVASTQDESGENENAQQWRRDRIRARLAEACHVLGQGEKAAGFEADLEASEAGRVELLRAERVTADTLADELTRIEESIIRGNMDVVHNALDLAVELYGRFFDDVERRDAVATLLREHRRKLPRALAVEILGRAVERAAQHEDLERAREWQALAAEMTEGAEGWNLDLYVPVAADLVVMQYRCGDSEGAAARADEVFEHYLGQRESVIDMFRAEALRPLAEANMILGRPGAARRVYSQALQEATLNPNSRPRSMDLAALCASMALSGCEPDAELWERLRTVRDSLSDPW
jgi:hypothetical protein